MNKEIIRYRVLYRETYDEICDKYYNKYYGLVSSKEGDLVKWNDIKDYIEYKKELIDVLKRLELCISAYIEYTGLNEGKVALALINDTIETLNNK